MRREATNGRVLTPIVVLVVAAGCGGEGEDGGRNNDPDPGEAQSAKEQDPAYDAARISCAEDGVEKLARALGVEATADTVAEAYAEEVSTPNFQDASREGCLAGLVEGE